MKDKTPLPSVDNACPLLPSSFGNVKVYVAADAWGGDLIVTP